MEINNIYYILGKSCSGKDTVYKELIKRYKFNELKKYTTRPKRSGETSGREYCFVDYSTYIKMKNAGIIIESRKYNTVEGQWIYYTTSENIDLGRKSYIGIGTIESYCNIKKYYNNEHVIPIYIWADDEIRLLRAIKREREQLKPNYIEMCRRFISDSNDFSNENLKIYDINNRFCNNGNIDETCNNIMKFIGNIINKRKTE